jgi:hypothetical protein
LTTGAELLEVAFTAIGEAGTWEDFNRVLGRAVPAGTARDRKDHGFEQARNHWFKEGTIGRRFVTEVLGTSRIRVNAVNTFPAPAPPPVV